MYAQEVEVVEEGDRDREGEEEQERSTASATNSSPSCIRSMSPTATCCDWIFRRREESKFEEEGEGEEEAEEEVENEERRRKSRLSEFVRVLLLVSLLVYELRLSEKWKVRSGADEGGRTIVT